MARKAAKLTQQDIADHFSITLQAVSSWERGKSEPDARRLWQLADLLKTEPAYFLGAGDWRMSPPVASASTGSAAWFCPHCDAYHAPHVVTCPVGGK